MVLHEAYTDQPASHTTDQPASNTDQPASHTTDQLPSGTTGRSGRCVSRTGVRGESPSYTEQVQTLIGPLL